MISLLATDETHETGTITGETQVSGITTVDGTETKVKTAVSGTNEITTDGTVDGTSQNDTIAAFGYVEIVMTWVDGKSAT